MFWEYYKKMLQYRIGFAVVIAVLLIVWGDILKTIVVPNNGLLVRLWLNYYYLLVMVSIVAAIVAAAFWFNYGFAYRKIMEKQYKKAFLLIAVVLGLINLIGAYLILPSVLSGMMVSAGAIFLGSMMYYYLDAVFCALPHLTGFVPGSKVLLNHIFGRWVPHRLELLNEDVTSFFSKRLVLISTLAEVEGDFKWKQYKRIEWQGKQYILLYPLQEKIFKYIKIEKLEEYVTFEVISKDDCNGIKVYLSIPYEDERLMPRIVEKIFMQDYICIIDEPPLVAVWPNFILRGLRSWDKYYFYCEGIKKPSIYFQPCWPEGIIWKREIYNTGNHCIVCSGSVYPTTLVCLDTETEETYGFIMVNEPEIINVGYYQQGSFSIDFGTVNTAVYFASDNQLARPWNFKSRVKVLWNGKDSARRLRRNFVPPVGKDSKNGWILSSFHIYNESKVVHDGELFATGNIFYVHSFSDLNDLRNVLSELKWQRENSIYAIGFLSQLCAECMAEAAAQGITDLTWRYSYPKSFVKNELESYINIWNEVMRILNNLTGCCPELKINCHVEDTVFVSESIALAAYCDKIGLEPLGNGSICLDIGGGSTDIVFWYGKEPDITWQGSFRLAGQHILRDYLLNGDNCLLLKKLCDTEEAQRQIEALYELALLNEKHAQKQYLNAFSIRLDAVLKYAGEEISNNLSNAVCIDTQIKHFQASLGFGLSGLFFYCGVIFGELYKNGYYKNLHKFHTIYVGGNGSKILDLAAGGCFRESSGFYKLLAQLFRDGVNSGAGEEKYKEIVSGMNLRIIRVEKSAMPKEEIVAGLFGKIVTVLGKRVSKEQIDKAEALKMPDAILTSENLFNTFIDSYNILAMKFLGQRLHFKGLNKNFLLKRVENEGYQNDVSPFISQLYTILVNLSLDASNKQKGWVFMENKFKC